MTVLINGTTGITTPGLSNSGALAGTTGTFTGLLDLSASTAGKIKFPPTSIAHSSSDANTLDDYEEGTWTPTDGSGAGLTFSVTSATYTKIGRLVFVTVYMTYPSTASSASAAISGLPFTAQNGNAYSYLSGRVQANLGNAISWQVTPGATTAYPNPAWNSVAGYTNAQLSGSFILISGCYQSNA